MLTVVTVATFTTGIKLCHFKHLKQLVIDAVKVSKNVIMNISKQSTRSIKAMPKASEKYTARSKLHTSYCSLLLKIIYLFSVSFKLTVGEPQMMYGNASSSSELEALSSQSSLPSIVTVLLHGKPVIKETDDQKEESWEEDEEDVELAIQRTALYNTQLVQNFMFHSINNENAVVKGHTAPHIVSLFRYTDSQTTTFEDEPSPKKEPGKCQRSTLKRCIDGLPRNNDTGLPTSIEEVNRACRVYNSGITCFDSWAKNCLTNDQREKAKGSIMGAHEMYSFLCKDYKFRKDFLKHAKCYKKLSPYWDHCSHQFMDGLWRNRGFNFTALCCVRLDFISCVSKYSSLICTKDATKFSMIMAETLIRTRTTGPFSGCIHVTPKHCIPIEENGVAHFRNHDVFLLAFALMSVVINGSGYFTKSL